MQIFKMFLILLVSGLALDALWLQVIATSFYKRTLGTFLRPTAEFTWSHWLSGGVVYVLIAIGMVAFVYPKIQSGATLWESIGYGALFGFLMYGIYEGTNYAILKNWPAGVIIADVLWGTFLCGTLALIAFYSQSLRLK